MKINRIVFTGDPLRPDHLNGPNGQTSNIRSFHALFSHQIFEATGIKPEAVYNGMGLDYEKSWALAGQEPNAETWAALFSEVPQALSEYWADCFNDALIVGFEIPPSLRKVFDLAEIPYVDLMIHPVRFMDDIFLAFQSNHVAVEEAIRAEAMPERLAYRAAGSIRSFAIRKRWTLEPRPFKLFAAQIGIDRSLIENGSLQNNALLLPRIVDAVGNADRLLFKDHPYEAQDALVKSLAATTGSIRRVRRNIYGLLSDPNIKEVISVSSSVGIEAKYFSVPCRYVIGPSTPVRFYGDRNGEGYWSVYNAQFTADFWRRILAPVLAVSSADGDLPQNRPNYLRQILRSFWGYQEIANDTFLDANTQASLGWKAKKSISRVVNKLGLAPAARSAMSFIRDRRQ